ncbi:MAG: alkaline phosphatase [Polyangiaceae bacterium]|nr:alkaline phosphatase [Polyangiaceae bacterium]
MWRWLADGLSATLGVVLLVGACGRDEPIHRVGVPLDTGGAPAGQPAKYVFFFIGDGMASVQIHATEAYLAASEAPDEVGGSVKWKPLGMTALPVRGIQQSSSWNSLITDSASAGTALATGRRTNDAVVGLAPSLTTAYPTIAEVAKAAGMKIGIVTSASLDHATPASFYAHVPSRGNYYDIGHDLVASGFDYFGGGGFLDPDGTAAGDGSRGNVLEAAQRAGYEVTTTREDFEALEPGTRAIAISPALDDRQGIFYEIDRKYANDPASHISLAEFTEKGIELLSASSGTNAGFFMMVEGGKIDWACHENDARTVVGEVLSLDDAVGVAIDFADAHPGETLIVVTGDHETGGMSLGWAGTAYASATELLAGQKVSFLTFKQRIAAIQAAGDLPTSLADTTIDEDMLELFGVDYATLNPFEKARLDAAFARAMFGAVASAEEDYALYGGYNAISITVTRIVANRAGIGWTSFAHTAAPVPVLAGGAGAARFAGYYENTEIAHKFARSMGLVLPD